MSSIMHTMLSTELTRIPGSMQHILGNNFDNTLCNGVTWLFMGWLILHFCYEKLINVYLKQMGFSKFLRVQLSNCLWLLVVYISFLAYYLVTTSDYRFFYLTRIISVQYEIVPFQKVLVHAIICSFYLHRGYVQGIRINSLHYLAKFLAITVVCTLAYILRLLEIPCTLTLLVATSGILEELTKASYLLLKGGGKFTSITIKSLFISTTVVMFTVYFVIIPLVFLIPLGLRLFSGNANFLILILYAFLLGWLNMDIYKSTPLNLMFHWLYHVKEASEEEEDEDEKPPIKLGCLGKLIVCSLFQPRTDEGYMLAYLRSEVKKRQKRLLSKRKPKNRNMLIQTLKCMMLIKRKLSEKKGELQDLDDSDDKEDYDEEDEIDTENFNKVKHSETSFNLVADNNHNKEENDDNDDDDDDELEIKSDDIEDNIESHSEIANNEPDLVQSENIKQHNSCDRVAGGNGFSH